MSSDNQSMETCYDDEPIAYCDRCLSLNIKYANEFSEADDDNVVECYCSDCGAGNDAVKQTDIASWEILYSKRYNKNFIKNGKNRNI